MVLVLIICIGVCFYKIIKYLGRETGTYFHKEDAGLAGLPGVLGVPVPILPPTNRSVSDAAGLGATSMKEMEMCRDSLGKNHCYPLFVNLIDYIRL